VLTPSRARQLLYAFVLIVPAYLYVGYVNFVRWQRGRELVANAMPIKVAITETGIEERTGSLGRTFYAPRIRYGVRTRDSIYIARQVTPLDEASTESWARALADRYKVGKVVDAYVEGTDAANPRTFLTRELGTFFYWTLAAGGVVFGTLALLWWRARSA
jgi:hypothetical protein